MILFYKVGWLWLDMGRLCLLMKKLLLVTHVQISLSCPYAEAHTTEACSPKPKAQLLQVVYVSPSYTRNLHILEEVQEQVYDSDTSMRLEKRIPALYHGLQKSKSLL